MALGDALSFPHGLPEDRPGKDGTARAVGVTVCQGGFVRKGKDMKRVRTKLLSIMLSVVLALTLLPVGAFANIGYTGPGTGGFPGPPTDIPEDPAKNFTNPIMEGIIRKINETIEGKGGYAEVSSLEETDMGGKITVTIIQDEYSAQSACLDIFGTILNTFYADYKQKRDESRYEEKRVQKVVPRPDAYATKKDFYIDFHDCRLPADSYGGIENFILGMTYLWTSKVSELKGRTLTFETWLNQSGDGREVRAVYEVAFVPHKEELTYHSAKAPTCTEAGTKEYYECSVCGKKFADETAKEVLTDINEKATGHKLSKCDAKDATCTEDGNIEYYECTVCKTKFTDETMSETIADTVQKATGHVLKEHAAKGATCTEDGNVAYYECIVCKKTFADKDAAEEITDTAVKAAHHWGDWREEGGYLVRTCSVCGETEQGEEVPQEQTPGAETPATDAPVEGTPSVDAPGADAPAVGTPSTEPTVADTPAAETPTTGTAAAEKPVEETSVTATQTVTPAVSVPKQVAMTTGQSTTKIQVPLAQGDKVVSVKSSNKNIAKVKVLPNGKIKVKAKKKTGTVKVKVKLASGKTVKFRVKVQKNEVRTKKILLPEKVKLHPGETAALNVVIKPVTSLEGVSYRSSDPRVAKVSKTGVVRALKKGTAIITVTSGSKEAFCKVKVK